MDRLLRQDQLQCNVQINKMSDTKITIGNNSYQQRRTDGRQPLPVGVGVEHFQAASGEGNLCEAVLISLSWLMVCVTLPFSLCWCFQSVQEYQRAVVLRLGRLKGRQALGPGMVFILPCTDEYYLVNMRVTTMDLEQQEVLTSDSVSVMVDAVLYYKVVAPCTAVCNVTNYIHSVRLLALTALRNVLGQYTLAGLLAKREDISGWIKSNILEDTIKWGIDIESVEIKDIRLPTDMKRSMAIEAEAQREANAKVIAAQGEKKASAILTEAAKTMQESPGAIQLRYMQTLNIIAAERNSTIIFPIPLDFLSFFKR